MHKSFETRGQPLSRILRPSTFLRRFVHRALSFVFVNITVAVSHAGLISDFARFLPFVKFYLIAMLFILFDIECVFLYPWAVLFKTSRVFLV